MNVAPTRVAATPSAPEANPMELRPLGNTGLHVSALGFGGAALGNEYGGIDDGEGERAVLAALEAGINFFDVAPYYGRTVAETRLGKALLGRRDEVVLATKCCRYDSRGFDFSAERVHADIDGCLGRLRTDRVDVFQIHDIEFGEKAQILNEALPAMREVQAAGKARFIGITGLPVHMLRGVAEEFPVDTVLSYCHYNLLVRDFDQVVRPLAEERGVGVILGSPLHMGILSPRGPQDWHPADEEVKATGRALVKLCGEHGRELVDVALRFALDYPHGDSVLCGMRTEAELRSNLASMATPNDPSLMAKIDELVAPVLDRTWHKGLPENAPPGE